MKIGILLAAGKSTRFGSDKLFATIKGETALEHSLRFLHNSCDKIFVAVNSGNKMRVSRLIKEGKFRKVRGVFSGGKTRFESVKNVVRKVEKSLSEKDVLVIHNAANPWATEEELARCFAALRRGISGVAAARSIDSTVKLADRNDAVLKTLPRENLYATETPQIVRAVDFLRALQCQAEQRRSRVEGFTDDLSVLEAAGFKTAIVKASHWNRKITRPENAQGDFLIGIGEDSHGFQKNIKGQKLGGLFVKEMPAVKANSDGDVILHALCNAISGALGKGSLGTYADALCKNGVRNSTVYLQKVLERMKQQKRVVHNCSISIEAGKPKIDPFVPALKKSLSSLLVVPAEKIGITATSGAGLNGARIRCAAAVLLTHL